jgi:hypothetical protein
MAPQEVYCANNNIQHFIHIELTARERVSELGAIERECCVENQYPFILG